MARLIDADLLKEKLDEREAEDIELYGCAIPEGFCSEDAKEVVDKMPTVDAVEVVRCKDCKFLHEKGYCTRVVGLSRIKPDDFCSYGERKEK